MSKARARRKLLIRVVQWLALALVGLDTGLYLAVVRPLRSLVVGEGQERDRVQSRVLDQQARLARLKGVLDALPATNKDIKVFLKDHVPPRRRGFSRAARMLRELSGESGVQLAPVSYRLGSTGEWPLEPLRIQVTVDGPFPAVLKFAHALENASEFVLVREFTLQAAENGKLELRLMADMYLVP